MPLALPCPSTLCLGHYFATAHHYFVRGPCASDNPLPLHVAPKALLCPSTLCLRPCSARAHCASSTVLAEHTVPWSPLCPSRLCLGHHSAQTNCALQQQLQYKPHVLPFFRSTVQKLQYSTTGQVSRRKAFSNAELCLAAAVELRAILLNFDTSVFRTAV